jgi:hypothetical protein
MPPFIRGQADTVVAPDEHDGHPDALLVSAVR